MACSTSPVGTTALLGEAAVGGRFGAGAVPAVLGLVTAVAVVLVEVLLIHAGRFHHMHDDMLGVAWWLPWLYVSGSVAMGNVGRFLAAAHGPAGLPARSSA